MKLFKINSNKREKLGRNVGTISSLDEMRAAIERTKKCSGNFRISICIMMMLLVRFHDYSESWSTFQIWWPRYNQIHINISTVQSKKFSKVESVLSICLFANRNQYIPKIEFWLNFTLFPSASAALFQSLRMEFCSSRVWTRLRFTVNSIRLSAYIYAVQFSVGPKTRHSHFSSNVCAHFCISNDVTNTNFNGCVRIQWQPLLG